MLDPRIYRGALLPVLLAAIVFAFSLENRPAPATTTLAPDAFVGARAAQDLARLAALAPERRPGSPGDAAVARRVAAGFRAASPTWVVSTSRAPGDTIDGERTLTTVLARQAGQPGPQLVVLAHRDAAGRGARAELSGTAGLLELARALGGGRLRRTVTLASVSGGSGGAAGAADLLRRLDGPVGAVIALGDLGGRTEHRPLLASWADDGGQSSLALRRTLEAALRTEAGRAGRRRARHDPVGAARRAVRAGRPGPDRGRRGAVRARVADGRAAAAGRGPRVGRAAAGRRPRGAAGAQRARRGAPARRPGRGATS